MKIKKKSLLTPKMFNILYSIGASIVILGALFKLLHVPGADFMLILGMGTEAVIFFISAFDEPAKEPNWEVVYPGIYDKEANLSSEEKQTIIERRKKRALANVSDNAGEGQAAGGAQVVGGGNATIVGGAPAGGTIIIGGGSAGSQEGAAGGPVIIGGAASAAPLVASGNVGVTPEQADQVTEATQKYVNTLNEISEALAKLQAAMSSLGDNNDYTQQMAALNRNISGLNTIYEIQLKSVSSQLGTIEQVNQGLANIRSLYENGQNDSYRIRQESDALARNLQQLNEVYARMLQAMTSSYGYQPVQQPYGQQPQQPYAQSQQPVYPQQPQTPQQQFGQQR